MARLASEKAHNNSEVVAMLMPRIKIALDYVMEKIETDGMMPLARRVYGVYYPTVYERTFDFMESFHKNETEVDDNIATGEYSFHPQEMTSNPSNFTHGSEYYDSNDVREFMADIIFEGMAGKLFGEGAWTHKRNAWHYIVKQTDGRIERYMLQGFKKAGLKVIK